MKRTTDDDLAFGFVVLTLIVPAGGWAIGEKYSLLWPWYVLVLIVTLWCAKQIGRFGKGD